MKWQYDRWVTERAQHTGYQWYLQQPKLLFFNKREWGKRMRRASNPSSSWKRWSFQGYLHAPKSLATQSAVQNRHITDDYMSKMPVSTTSTANSKISCPLVLQLFQEGSLQGWVRIKIAESEYEKPVANTKIIWPFLQATCWWDLRLSYSVINFSKITSTFNRTQFSFTRHSDTSLLHISRSDLLQPEVTTMQFCYRQCNCTRGAVDSDDNSRIRTARLDEIRESLPQTEPSRLQACKGIGNSSLRVSDRPLCSWSGSWLERVFLVLGFCKVK